MSQAFVLTIPSGTLTVSNPTVLGTTPDGRTDFTADVVFMMGQFTTRGTVRANALTEFSLFPPMFCLSDIRVAALNLPNAPAEILPMVQNTLQGQRVCLIG